MIRIFKYWAGLWMKKRLAKEYSKKQGNVDELFRQAWTHSQGLILSRGKIKWNWGKVLRR